jgi:PAS domain S-box-containing protein
MTNLLRDPSEAARADGPGDDTLRALRGSHELLGTFFETASIGIKLIDLRTFKLVDANPSFQRMLGYSLDELCSRPYADFTHPDDVELEAAAHAAVVDGNADSFNLVKRYIRKDGSTLPVRVTASVVRDAAGALRFGVSMVEDVSREHAADVARRAAEERHRLIVETTMEGIWLLDADDRTTFANEAMASMLGVTVQEMLGRSMSDFDSDRERTEQAMARRRAGIHEQLSVALRRRDGSTLETLLSATPLVDEDGAYIGALAMVRDNTELRRSQESVAARVRQLETIAALGREILAERSLGELFEQIGPSVAKALDVDRVTVLALQPDGSFRVTAGAGWEDGVVGELVVPAAASQAGYQLASGEKRLIVEDLQLEERFVPSAVLLELGIRGGLSCRIDGEERPFGFLAVHTYAPRTFTEDDANFIDSVANLLGWVVRRDRAGVLRRRAEQDLLSTAERFRMLAENAQDIVFRYRLGENGGYEYISPAVTPITGLTPEQFYADRDLVLPFLAAEDVEKVVTGRERSADGPLLFRFNRADGELVWLERRATYVRDDAGGLVAMEGIIRDVSERVAQEERRRALEDQLRQSQKLEAIGQLAGGIAHDFNNLLLGIRGFGELARRRIDRGEQGAVQDIEEMLQATDKAADLTRQLLAFGRRQVLNPTVLNLSEVVTDMDRLLRRLIGEQVELVTVCPEEPVLVEADRSQIEQVVANLAVNARDAVADGGRVLIEVSLSPDGENAMLFVSDNGGGMDAETAARAFEPFFSTKGERGSGLGLATVHGIVNQSGGRIWVDSDPGKGTTVSILLPRSSGHVAPVAASAPEAADGAETLLVGEDDSMVRSIVKAMLENRGYRVIAADSGEAALAAIAALAEPVDLVLSDLVMPGLSGRQTVDRVRELRPDAKVLYMSGYTDDVVIRGGAFQPGTSFIQKPFDAESLARRIREMLDVEAA